MAGDIENADILNAINQIIKAINDKDMTVNEGDCTPETNVSITNSHPITVNITADCGCGAGGAQPGQPASGTEPGDPADPDNCTPPDGFSDCAEYWAYKCDVATYIVDNLLTDTQWWQGVNISILTATTVAGALLSFVPGVNIVALLGMLLLAIAEGIQQYILQDAEDALTSAYDDLICVLYNAQTAADAMTDILSAISDAVDSVEADTLLRYETKTFLNYHISQDGLNKLFDLDQSLVNLPTGDCEACVENCPDYLIVYGTYVSEGVISAEYEDGWYWVSLHFGQQEGGPTCGNARDITVDPTPDAASGVSSSIKGWRIDHNQFLDGTSSSSGEWDEVEIQWPTPQPISRSSVRTLTLASTASFQIVLTLE